MFNRSRQSSSSSSTSTGSAGRSAIPVIDFDAEARNLWARLNLDRNTRNFGQWNPLDSIYRHPTGGGTIYVGNQSAAENYSTLKSHGITRVVNCTFGESKIPNYHASRGIEYFNFPISHWQMYVNSTNASVLGFVEPLFEFIEFAISRGDSILIHCLAGAHRAGTTGVACLVHYLRCEPGEAITIAKRCRPIIDPIGQLPDFLHRLYRAEEAQRTKALESNSSGGEARKGALSVLDGAYFRTK
eukprot:gene4278-4698_t